MSRTTWTVAVIAALAGLLGASPALGTPAARTPIRIDAQAQGYESCTGTFLLMLGTNGDVGKTACHLSFGSVRKTAEGLSFEKVVLTSTFIGKAGTITIVVTGRTYELGFGNSHPWEGTWRIVKGTGRYAGIRGGGAWRGADDRRHITLADRYAGFVTGV